jgi:transcriptional regulator with XRE-family HTH domain
MSSNVPPTREMIQERRSAAEITQAVSATLLYVHVKTWQQWESGRRPMHRVFWEFFKSKTSWLDKPATPERKPEARPSLI